MAALSVSFRKRNFLSFSFSSGSTSHTTRESDYSRTQKELSWPGLSPCPLPEPQFLHLLMKRNASIAHTGLREHEEKAPFPQADAAPHQSTHTGCRAEARLQPSSRHPWATVKEPQGCLPGANPRTTIFLPRAWSFATVGSPSQPLTSNPQPDRHPGTLPAPDPPHTTPDPQTMTFLSTGLFFLSSAVF